jgi:hypothetical protein
VANTRSSIRIPGPLRDRIRERAEVERRSFSSQCVVLIEEALADRELPLVVDADEVDRLAAVARTAIEEARSGR